MKAPRLVQVDIGTRDLPAAASAWERALGLAFTHTGWLYPFFAALLGWLGVALTGSDRAAHYQYVVIPTLLYTNVSLHRLTFPFARAVTAEFVPALNQHHSHLELRIGRDGNVEIVPTGIPGLVDQLQRAIDDLKRRFFGN